MKAAKYTLVIFAMLLATGCSSPIRKPDILSPNHPYDVVKDDDFAKRVSGRISQVDNLEQKYYDEPDPKKQLLLRNQIVGILLSDINEYWRRFMTDFYGRYGIFKTSTEVGAGFLSGAAAITTPPNAAKILSALSTAVTGLGTSVEKNILQDNAADVLIAQMDADRQQIGLNIYDRLNKDVATYSLSQALYDVSQYATAMSVPHALTSIRGKVGAQSNAAQAQGYPLKDQPVVAIPTAPTAAAAAARAAARAAAVAPAAPAAQAPAPTVLPPLPPAPPAEEHK